MSQRSLIEFNHDYGPFILADKDVLAWGRHICEYLRSGDAESLPYGATLKHRRHHSEPEPVCYDDPRVGRAIQALTDILGLASAPGRFSIRSIAAAALADLHGPAEAVVTTEGEPVIQENRRIEKGA